MNHEDKQRLNELCRLKNDWEYSGCSEERIKWLDNEIKKIQKRMERYSSG